LGAGVGSPRRVLGSIRPANTIMQVVRFIDPDWLVEIEADAVVES
jgi:enamine deaminase RidA (YjgF/YER057c/UK114 family)